MYEVLVWLYLVTAVFLINHEIDSAFQKEWELFHLPGGITGFLVVHFPLLFLILVGLLLLCEGRAGGLIFSLILSLSGVFAFCIHLFFIKRGKREFRSAISLFILLATLILSLFQGGVTLFIIFKAR